MKYILFLYHQYEINHLLLPPSPDDEDTLFSYAQVYGICFFTGCGRSSRFPKNSSEILQAYIGKLRVGNSYERNRLTINHNPGIPKTNAHV